MFFKPADLDNHQSHGKVKMWDSRNLSPSLFPQFDVNFHDLKIIHILNEAFESNNMSDPYTFLLMGNELFWVTQHSVEILAVLIDISVTQSNRETINITGVQVIFKNNRNLEFRFE